MKKPFVRNALAALTAMGLVGGSVAIANTTGSSDNVINDLVSVNVQEDLRHGPLRIEDARIPSQVNKEDGAGIREAMRAFRNTSGYARNLAAGSAEVDSPLNVNGNIGQGAFGFAGSPPFYSQQLRYPSTADGRYILFMSTATNFALTDDSVIPFGTGGKVYVFDTETGEAELASIDSDGEQFTDAFTWGFGDKIQGDISPDGRYVTFSAFSDGEPSFAGDGVHFLGFRHDRDLGETIMFSVATGDPTGSLIAPPTSIVLRSIIDPTNSDFIIWNGGVGFPDAGPNAVTTSNGTALGPQDFNIWRYDAANEVQTLLVEATDGGAPDAEFSNIEVSFDGNFVVFSGNSENIAPAPSQTPDFNQGNVLYVHNVTSGNNFRLDATSTGTPGNGHTYSINAMLASASHYAVFNSTSNNLGATVNVSSDPFVSAGTPAIDNIYRKKYDDGISGELLLVNTYSDGTEWNDFADYADVSSDGRFVVFRSGEDQGSDYDAVLGASFPDVNGQPDLFVKDLDTGSVKLFTRYTDGTAFPQGGTFLRASFIGAPTSNWLTIASTNSNIDLQARPDTWDVFFAEGVLTDDFPTSLTRIVASPTTENYFNNNSFNAATTTVEDGDEYITYTVFTSYASNIIAGDTNQAPDIFRHVRVDDIDTTATLSSTFELVSEAFGGGFANGPSGGQSSPVWDNTALDAYTSSLETEDRHRRDDASSMFYLYGNIVHPNSITNDGNVVAFTSAATNLMDPDGPIAVNPGTFNVYYRDMTTGVTNVATRNAAGDETVGGIAGKISGSGSHIVYMATSTELNPSFPLQPGAGGVFQIWRYDVASSENRPVSYNSAGNYGFLNSIAPDISDNGRFVTFVTYDFSEIPSNTNDFFPKVVHTDMGGGTPFHTLVSANPSVGADGTPHPQAGLSSGTYNSWPRISPDGQKVLFLSSADFLGLNDAGGPVGSGIVRLFATNYPERDKFEDNRFEAGGGAANNRSVPQLYVWNSQTGSLQIADAIESGGNILRGGAFIWTDATTAVEVEIVEGRPGIFSGDSGSIGFWSASDILLPTNNPIYDVLVGLDITALGGVFSQMNIFTREATGSIYQNEASIVTLNDAFTLPSATHYNANVGLTPFFPSANPTFTMFASASTDFRTDESVTNLLGFRNPHTWGTPEGEDIVIEPPTSVEGTWSLYGVE